MAKKGKKSNKYGAGTKSSKGGPAKQAARADRSAKATKHPKSKTAEVTPLAPVAFSEALRVREGFVLAECDPRSTPAFDGDKDAGKAALDLRAGRSASSRSASTRRRRWTASGPCCS